MSGIEDLSQRWGGSYKWLVTFTVMMGTISTTATATIANVALPYIAGQFSLGADETQWVSTAFLAAMTGTMLVTAWATDTFGQKTAFMGAIAVFVLGSLVGFAATSGNMVILGRILQGAAAGFIQPQAMAMIFSVFPKEQRGLAMGIYGVGIVLAPALGPTVGGIMVDNYSWRYVFLVAIPFCVTGFLTSPIFLPDRDANVPKRGFDWLGFILITVFLVSLLSTIANGQREGWDSPSIFWGWVVAIASGTAFAAWEMTTARPMLDVAVLGFWRFAAGCVVALMLGTGIYGSTYLVPLFVETVQGYSPTSSGILLMPAGIVLGAVFPLSGALSDKLPPRWPIMAGLFCFGVSCLLLSGVHVDSPFWQLAWWITLGRVGLGLILPSMNVGALRALPMAYVSQGSGVLNFFRQFGGALGVNLLAMMVDRRAFFHSHHLAESLTWGNRAVFYLIQRLSETLVHWGNPFGTPAVGEIHPGALPFLARMVIPKAFMKSYQDGFMLVAIAFFLAIIPAWFMKEKKE